MHTATNLLAAVTGLFIATVVIEALVRHFIARKRVDWREVGVSLIDLGVRRSIDLAGITLVSPIPLLAWRHRLGDIPMNSAWTWLGLYLLVELAYYWHHRFAHTVRLFWATHSVHHSSNAYMPVQYLRLGLQFTAYQRYNGATTNYDGFGRNAHDNNSVFVYAWFAY